MRHPESRHPVRRRRGAGLTLLALAVAGCASKPDAQRPEPPTLATLATRQALTPAAAPRPPSDEAAAAAYRAYLAAVPAGAQRAQAQRRLGDLAMDAADRQLEAGAPADAAWREAIARYETVLREQPDSPAHDRVLYQLARAHELRGAAEAALATLDRLVARQPAADLLAEAQFRRGELLFSARDFAKAEAAFEQVLWQPQGEALHGRSRYMLGWSQYKQARLDEALRSFMLVLDGTLGGQAEAASDPLASLPRAQREWVDDTLRVVGLSLQQGQGAAGIARLLDGPRRRAYGFVVYEQLGELYLSQDRVRDAAESFAALAAADPAHPEAARLQARVIDTYAAHGFERQALDAARSFVARQVDAAGLARRDPRAWAQVGPLLRRHLLGLAQYHHGRARSTRPADDGEVREAERAYRQWLALFGDDPEAGQQTFMLGELMTEARRWGDAVVAYELSAYGPGSAHARQADAGYAALWAQGQRLRAGDGADAATREAWTRASLDSAQRFAERFPRDLRTASVLADGARQWMARGDGARAADWAARALAQGTAPASAQRDALAVLADRGFETGRFAEAEQGYEGLLAVLPGDALAERQAVLERLAAAIHRQGEQARDNGRADDAARHFDRAVARAPRSRVAAAALFDRAALAASMQAWSDTVTPLTALRSQHPDHPLAAQVPAKLAAAWLALDRPADAAAEFERIADHPTSPPELARSALWQASQLQEQAGDWPAAQRDLERLLRGPLPADLALEVRWRLLELARRQQQPSARIQAMAEGVRSAAAAEPTERGRALAARARLVLAEPARVAYTQAVLAEPLARSLGVKKARLEAALQAYATAATDAPADVVSEATWRSGQLYADFGRALLAAPRPKGLRKAEAEQYGVLLEEQAFPFEEKAAEFFETNARRTAQGQWDEAIRSSIAELARLRPARWARRERVEGLSADASAAALQRWRDAVVASPEDPARWNALGVASREAGQFDEARRSYERAAALGPGYAPAVLNLAILDDIYLRQPARALASYERFQAMVPAPDPEVTRWMAELRQRKPDVAIATAGATR